MYGIHVHEAVLNAGESESGITIHLVNEEYDKGRILFQGSLAIRSDDTPESLAARVLVLEHKNYAPVIEKYVHSVSEGIASKPG